MQSNMTNLRKEIRVSGCDTRALVALSDQFAELELEMVRRSEITAAQLAADKADWAKAGDALGQTYQALCDDDNAALSEALRTIETILAKHGVLVRPPRKAEATEGAGHGE